MNMRFSNSVVVQFAATILATSSYASCYICDEVVEFGAAHAACFLSDYEQFSSTAEETGRVEVDLSLCLGEVADGTRGLEAFPFFPGQITGETTLETTTRLRTTYILDLESLNCLYKILSERSEPINPSVLIDLPKLCP